MDNLDNFEQILKQQNSSKKTLIYNKSVTNKQSYKPQDVLDSVYSQMKAIQQADCVKKCSKLKYLNVNKTPIYHEVQKPKFDSQFATDTQLIDIIDNAEALNAPKGMTQEFDVTFVHANTEKITTPTKDPHKNADENIADALTPIERDKDGKIDNKTEDKRIITHNNEYNLSTIKDYDTNVKGNVVDVFTPEERGRDSYMSHTFEDAHTFTHTHVDCSTSRKNDQENAKVETEKDRYCANSKKVADSKTVINLIQSSINDKAFNANVFPSTSKEIHKINVMIDISNTMPCSVDTSKKVVDCAVSNKNSSFLNNSTKLIQTKFQKEQNLNTIDDIKMEIDYCNNNSKYLTNSKNQALNNVERSPSPVLSISSSKRPKMTKITSLTVSLEEFENFAAKAMSVIHNNSKNIHLINSQILGQELCLNLNTNAIELSPIIDTSEMLHISKEELLCKTQSSKKIKRINNKNEQSEKPNIKTDTLEISKALTEEELEHLINDSDFDKNDETDKNNYQDIKFIKDSNVQIHKGSLEKNTSNAFTRKDHKPYTKTINKHTDRYPDEIAISSDEEKENYVQEIIRKDNKPDTRNTSKNSDRYSDEILFSSDEENENYTQKDVEDLPLTLALETSFYDIPDVLNTTMYVGFQTASNKSIEIKTQSFSEAKALLEKEVSLTNLVSKFDGNANSEKENVDSKCEDMQPKLKNDLQELFFYDKTVESKYEEDVKKNDCLSGNLSSPSNNMNSKANTLKSTFEVSDNICKYNNIFIQDLDQDLVKTQFSKELSGFKTASNKDIFLLDKALSKTKAVFQDIDLNKDFNTEINAMNSKKDSEGDCKESKVESKDSKVNRNCNKSSLSKNSVEINDKNQFKIIQEEENLNDDLLIQEFENIEMSLDDSATIIDKHRTDEPMIDKSKKDQEMYITKDKISLSTTDKKVAPTLAPNFNPNGLFKTANNKNIHISAKALSRTKEIFQNINIDYDKESILTESNLTSSNKAFEGFRTANNKIIKVSDAALSKTKGIFKDIENEAINYNDKMVDDIAKRQVDELHAFDNKNSIDIDTNKVKEIPENHQKVAYNPSKLQFEGFKTASNKSVTISEEAFRKSRNIFQDLDQIGLCSNMDTDLEKTNVKKGTNEESNIENNVPNYFETFENSDKAQSLFIGFQTASKKAVTVSVESLAKSKKILELDKPSISKSDTYSNVFNADDIDEVNVRTRSKDPYPNINKAQSPFKGFQTASNKKVTVSKESLAKSKKLLELDKPSISKSDPYSNVFNADDIDEVNVGTRTIDPYPKINKAQSPFKGFQTASNKKVTVSKESFAKSKKLLELDKPSISKSDPNSNVFNADNFEEVNVVTQTKDPYPNINKAQSPFKGFQTASNKKVTVSKESLAKSKKLLELDKPSTSKNDPYSDAFNALDFDEVNVGTRNKDPYPSINKAQSPFKGFQTASSKVVTVSKESLAKSKKLLEFDELSASKTDPYCTTINADNLDKVDAVTWNTDPYPNINKTESLFKGFQTASNKAVTVSKENFAKSKKKLDFNEPSTSKTEYNADGDNPLFNVEVDGVKTRNKDPYPNLNKDQNPFKGFQTASNKQVIISPTALLKSKAVFENLESVKIPEKVGKLEKYYTVAKLNIDCNSAATEQFKIPNKTSFVGFQTGSNKRVAVSEEALAKSKALFDDVQINKEDLQIKEMIERPYEDLKKDSKASEISGFTSENNDAFENTQFQADYAKESHKDTSINVENIINTQVINNFGETLCTEDFYSTPKPKRSTSPILSCPRAKKRRFETPYKNFDPPKAKIAKTITIVAENLINFDDNYKNNQILKLKDLQRVPNKEIDSYLLNFDLDNLLDFKFFGPRNDVTEKPMSTKDVKHIFLNAVDKKLVPPNWIENHLKLILWKLISYEVNYDYNVTAKSVLAQLKYRFDKELNMAKRPALRKIMEKDDVASKTLVLCVAGIYVNGLKNISPTTTDNIELLLTDGWYFIKATIDKMLSKFVYDGKIKVGCKIVTCGAELINCEQGISPWEDISVVRLKIFGNCTRRAQWDAKLGYHSASVMSQLSNVSVFGGKVCRMRVFVTRVYPLLYVEKFEDGSTVTRSERLEHLHQMKYESDKEVIMEKIYEEVQKEFEQESQESDNSDYGIKKCLETGSQISCMMKKCTDPMEFRAQLTLSQVNKLQEYTSKYRDKVLSAIQERIKQKITQRNVVPLARAKIAGFNIKNDQVITTLGMLSIWKPNDAILDILKEESWIELINVVPTAIRYSEIQISAGRQSLFKQSTPKENPLLNECLKNLKRKTYSIQELTKKPVNSEIDTIGIIFLIDPSNTEFDSTKQFQNIFLADLNKNMICINFWGGINKFGFQNVISLGQVIYCANLQKRAGNSRKNIPQFRVTEFTAITKTPKSSQCREIIDHLNETIGLDRKKFIEDCVAIKNNYLALKSFNENESPYNKSDYNFSRNKTSISTCLKHVDFNLTGLDFESSFKLKETQLSPKTLERKKKVNERIAKLKMYSEPPPLSPINILNKSKNAGNSFKNPFVNDSMVESLQKSNKNSSLNKTFVKNIIQPIKLNFSKELNDDNIVDHFAEEFDGSPPLSLD